MPDRRSFGGHLHCAIARHPCIMWSLVLLPLVGLFRSAKVSGFFLSSAGRSIRATTPPRGRRRVAAASTATASARIDGCHQCCATSMMSSDGVPAVVVSFGLTPEERLVAEEVVFRRGPTFPAGVRFVDGSAAAGDCGDSTTIRQALLSSASPGPTGDSPLPQALVNAMPDGQSTTTLPPPTTDSSSPGSTTTATTVFMPNLLLVLQSPTHVSPAEAEGGPGWLEMAVMGALDDFETVPPAIISCVPPMMLEEAASSGSSSTLPFSTFDAALLDMPLSEVWRREARRHFDQNGLFEPLEVHETDWSPSSKDVTVAMNLEMDGAWVASKTAPEGERWDTSKLVVIDGLVDEPLCRDLLDLVTEPGWATTAAGNSPPSHQNRNSNDKKGEEEEGHVARVGPPESKWERGLTDVDVEEDEVEEEEDGRGRGAGPGSWGLTEGAIEWLCRDGEHPAIVELHSRLCKLYPEFAISHMPEAVMGPSTARMVANAPVYGDRFSWHVDADPSMFPPSPWRDHFGTYTNREPGMPLFATLLVYLDADWRREWDAETLFLDPPTDTGVFVRPRGGRAIVMDQDVTHRISTPSQAAARPRYSLVLKLIFFSRQHHGHYLHPSLAPAPPAAASPPAAVAATAASAAAPSADLCISSLSALRGTRGIGKTGAGSVSFGSAITEAEAAAEEQASSPPLQRPALSRVQGEVEDDGSVQGAGDGGGDGDGLENRHEGVDTAAAATAAAAAGPFVEVRPVGGKGMGLFSTRPIAKGLTVAFYSGEVLTVEQLDDRYPDFEGSEYVMQLGPDQYLDARDPDKSSIARYANHSGQPNLVVELRPIEDDDDSTRRTVAVLGPDADMGVALTTLRDVEAGEELTFDYGDDYFDGDDLGAVIEDGQDMRSLLGGVDWGPSILSL